MSSDTDEIVKTQRNDVESALSTDLAACDCLMTLFQSALFSYRHDTILKPFPQQFVSEDGTKDIERLRHDFDGFPSLEAMKEGTKSPNQLSALSDKHLHLLHWVVQNKNFTLRSKSVSSKFPEIEDATSGSTHTVKPCAIFELEYTDDQETKWGKLTKNHGSFLAYHGTRVENLHCISHIGLLSHMNKTGIFGEGTYLSTDLGVCMNFSPSANMWRHSALPSLCSMVAVCQVVNTPEIRSRVQVGGEPSIGQKIPERYFVVTNDELIRLKFILVFAQQSTVVRRNQRRSLNFLYQHKWTLIVIIYMLFLLIIGLYNSRYVNNLYSQYTRRYLTI